MKKLTYLLTAGVLLAVLTIVGCKKDDGGGLSEEEQQLAALSGTWAATDVNDGAGPREDYSDFVLTINGANQTYTSTGGPDLLPMPKAAPFEFGTNVKTGLILEPDNANIQVTYGLSADGTELTWSFNNTGTGYENARQNSVEGNWTFVFTKQ